jgi:hypothetical protein
MASALLGKDFWHPRREDPWQHPQRVNMFGLHQCVRSRTKQRTSILKQGNSRRNSRHTAFVGARRLAVVPWNIQSQAYTGDTGNFTALCCQRVTFPSSGATAPDTMLGRSTSATQG